MKLVVSFGFRYGKPMHQFKRGRQDKAYTFDEIHDVRVLYGKRVDNPYHDPRLASLNGLHPDVQQAVLGRTDVQRFIDEVIARNPDSVAIGCTAGRHRSVAIAEEIARRTGAELIHLNQKNWPV